MRLFRGKNALLLILALPALLVACSDEDEVIVGPSGPDPVDPLTAEYWPLDTGSNWSYLRHLRAEKNSFGSLLYQGYDLEMVQLMDFATETPFVFLDSPHVYLEVTGTEQVGGTEAMVLRGTRSEEHGGLGDIINQLEIYLDPDAGGIRFLGENEDTAVDSTMAIEIEPFEYDMIRFGETSWSYSLQDYSGEPDGMIPLGADLDFDTYGDSLIGYDLFTEVVAEQDMNLASELSEEDLEYLVDQGLDALIDTVIENCRWVRQSLVLQLMLTNQRDPNTGPGQSGIGDDYLPERKRWVSARYDLRLWLLAPDLGPVRIVTCRDLDGLLMNAPLEETELLFQPDLLEIDYLVDSNLLR